MAPTPLRPTSPSRATKCGCGGATLLESGSIRLKDVKGTRSIRLALATTDIGAALRGAALVLAPVPATAQADIAHAMAPHLEREQVVFCSPGTFGSYAMAVITGRDASF